jgi:hypothetical protein
MSPSVTEASQSALSTNPARLWTPSNPQDTSMEKFRLQVNEKHNLKLGTKHCLFIVKT